jgi:hypothetical protein
LRNISVALTKRQVRAREKTVTRRTGWLFVQVGDELQPVDRVMGFKKGERPENIGGPVRVVSVRRERLELMPESDLALEGFPNATLDQFFALYIQANGGDARQFTTRIEWVYL